MKLWGEWFALLAAAGNGSIGSFNRLGFHSEAGYESLAFFKCLGAWLCLTVFASFKRGAWQQIVLLRPQLTRLAFLAFLGVFTLYFFETWAFSLAPIPVVAFMTYASGIVTVVLGGIVLKEPFGFLKTFSVVLVAFGILALLFGLDRPEIHGLGAGLALIGGLGYSLFLFFWRKFGIASNTSSLWWFFTFGTLFLALPWIASGAVGLPRGSWLPTLGLVLIPTLGGYYCTCRALSLTEASRVQVIETGDALFASFYGFIFFGDTLSPASGVGAEAIFLGILMLVIPRRNVAA